MTNPSDLSRLGDADILGELLAPEERDAALDAVFASLAADAEAMARRYTEVLADARDGDHLVDALEEHLRRFAPGASGTTDITARERLFYLAVAACDDDPAVARRLRDLAATTARAFEPVIAEYLTLTRRRPRPGTSLGDLPHIAGALIEGLVLRMRADPTRLDRSALSVLRALEGWTEPEPGAGGASAESIEQRVRELDRRLGAVDPASPQGLRLALELLDQVPRSALAFWRARRRLGPLLADARLGDSELGRRVQLAAGEVLALADGDRSAVEAAIAVRRTMPPEDAMSELRFAWLLLRLDRFAEAGERLAAVATRGNLDHETQTLLRAFAAYSAAATGPPDQALDLARDAMEGTGMGAPFGRAVAVRLLTRSGALDEAAALAEPGSDAASKSLGSTALLIAQGTLDVAAGRPTRALDRLTAARDALRMAGSRNPAGWPWLEPAVGALMQLGRPREARAVIEAAASDAVRWGTPLVLAELHRSRALVSSDDEAAAAHQAAAAALADSEAALERHLTDADGVLPPATPAILSELTPRVREVALFVAQGLRDGEIAERLTISPRTVNRHVARALKATGVRNRVELTNLVRAATPDAPTEEPPPRRWHRDP